MSQVALSLLLLIASGLFVRSLRNLQRQGEGLDRHQILTVRMEPRGSDQRNIPDVSPRLDAIYRDLIMRIERLPGVESATLAHTAPLSPIAFGSPVTPLSGTEIRARILMTYPKYFATMGIPLIRGRDFDDRDLRPGAERVVVANETFVRQALHGQEPVAAACDRHSRARPVRRSSASSRTHVCRTFEARRRRCCIRPSCKPGLAADRWCSTSG